MKSFTIILILILIRISLKAQPFGNAAPDYKLLRMDYENSSGEGGATFFRYDTYGRPVSSYWCLNDKSKYSVNNYITNSEGLITSAWRKISDGLTSFELFIYDSEGNKTYEYFRRSDGITGHSNYIYKRGRLEIAKLNNHKGWINGNLKYKYDGRNKPVSGTLEKNGVIISVVRFDYDSNENLIKESWNFQDKWKQTFRYFYERTDIPRNYYSSPLISNSGSLRVSKEDYNYNNEQKGTSCYIYDENGLLKTKTYTRSDGLSTTSEYVYDKDRKLSSSTRINQRDPVTRFNYQYDGDNNLILRTSIDSDTISGFESYFYDSDGMLVKSYVKNLDNWLTGTIAFMTDETGKITGGTFKGNDGFDAAITYVYNELNLVTEIIWQFTSGKFQKYVFVYEDTGKD